MQGPLVKYKIGLSVIGLFGLILTIMVISQAGATKADNKTYQQASKVADSLNSYTETAAELPDSLASAGISGAPGVSYSKLSDDTYQFCVTYKATVSGFDAASVESNIVSGGAGDSGDFGPEGNDGFLVLDTSHHKGKNCQNVKVEESTVGPPIEPLDNSDSGTDNVQSD